MSSNQIYRNCIIGKTLQESLDEMLKDGKITPDQAKKVLAQYDRSMSGGLADRAHSKIIFKADKLKSYRSYDNKWVLLLNNVRFKGDLQIPEVGTMKIIASSSNPEP